MMRKFTPVLFGAISAAALAVAGVAIAQPQDDDAPAQHWGMGKHEMGPTTRSDAEARAQKMFARMDVNQDGALTPEDREARVEQHFAKLDTNNDGALSLEEFTAGRGKMGHGKMDGDHDGKMGHRGHRGDMMGKMADTDNDGKVTAAEFTAAALTRFDSADANHDGTLTPEERKAAMQAMREQHRQARAAGQSQTN